MAMRVVCEAQAFEACGAHAECDEFYDEDEEYAQEADSHSIGLKRKPCEPTTAERDCGVALTYSCQAGERQGELNSSMAGSKRCISAVAIWEQAGVSEIELWG